MMISNHTHERRVVERDERQLVVLHTMGQSDLQYVVQSGSSLQLDVVVIGDRAGMVDMTLAVQLADVDAAADVRVLALVQSARVRISTSLAIAPGAQQTDGKLVMRGLLLDDAASIAMTPGLDVAANDVSA
ncbi:MAG: SufD family Fe-S cluster assembly protein [Candidatus Peribacteria bacterium]|nr:MAG: SufD family Fe-S cluster assembly protein [Candidatus Peribacteria bacterium]